MDKRDGRDVWIIPFWWCQINDEIREHYADNFLRLTRSKKDFMDGADCAVSM